MTGNSPNQIAEGHVVSIHYTLTLDDGEEVDTSRGRDALEYLHGHSNIVPGLESQLTGLALGEKIDAVVAAAEGYGERQDDAVQEVPLDQLPEGVEEGMQLQAQTPAGAMLVRVAEVKESIAVLDFNHPLAGQTLNFAVEIVAIRDATEEEIEQGHPAQ